MRQKPRNQNLPLQVWGNRVLLRAVTRDVVNVKLGSLYLPQSAAEDHQRQLRWEIVALGDNVYDPDLQPGLEVIASRWATDEISWENEKYRVAYAENIIAILVK